MRYLLLPFFLAYGLHAFAEIRKLRQNSPAKWAFITAISSKCILLLGMLLFMTQLLPPALRDVAYRITSVATYFEFYFAFTSAPPQIQNHPRHHLR